MDTYEEKPDGNYGAVDGCHDDMVITTAGTVWLAIKEMPPPKEIDLAEIARQRKIATERSVVTSAAQI
jgi:hypothetical protein